VDCETAGDLKNGEIKLLRGTTKPVYQATTLNSKEVVLFYPDKTYKFPKTGETGKWKSTKYDQMKAQQDALRAAEDKKPKPLNGNQLKVLELMKPLRWFNTPVPTDVEVDNGMFLKMDLSKTDGGGFANLSNEDIALAGKYYKYFEKDYPKGFFVYKKVSAQTPTNIGQASKVEITIESCKAAIESLYNNMISPRTYPLEVEDKNTHKNTAKLCIEPANKGKFIIRFGLKNKIDKLKERRVI
jgi:hypothetical protein